MTAQQVKNNWGYLYQKYKSYVDNTKTTGRSGVAKPKYFKEMEEIYGYRPIMYNEHESIVGLPELLPITSTASSPTSAVAAIGESAGPSRVSQENVHISKKRPVMAILSDDEDVNDPVIHIPNKELSKKSTKN